MSFFGQHCWIFSMVALVPYCLISAATLYGTTGKGAAPSVLYTIDATTGDHATIGGVTVGGDPVTVNGLTFDGTTQTLYAHTGAKSLHHPNSLLTIDVTSGAASVIGSSVLENVITLACDVSGNLYAWWKGPNPAIPMDDLASIDKATGQATRINDSRMTTTASGMAFDRRTRGADASTNVLHFINGYDLTYWQVNAKTGLATKQGELTLEFLGSHGDINPDSSALQYYQPELERQTVDVNARIQVIDLATRTVASVLRTSLNDLHTLAFAVPPPGGPAWRCTQTCSTGVLGLTGYVVRRTFPSRGQCYDKCSLLGRWKARFTQWECGSCR
jgi:hypothetical protein